MEDHKLEIKNWDLGAGIYIKYYTLRRSLKEDESSMNEPVCNSVTYNDRMVAISARSSALKPEQESKNNKIGVREEYTAGGPTNAKLHALARGPRLGSMALARFSTIRATAFNDRELL
nr:nuclear pore complex protein NUP96 isoform X1 [Tanacetum cinerariifolium]